jgi:hypothetical protein
MEHHIRFDADAMTLYLLDQRALPGREDYLPIRTLDETIRALQVMVVRGAPAIGVTAGFGCVLALEELRRGLPAGAITNPGIDAIAAALNPDQEYLDEGYYFFVTGNPNGDHPGEYFYAKTADEHHQNCIIAGWG